MLTLKKQRRIGRSKHRAEGSLGSQATGPGTTETSGLPEDSARCVALLNQTVGDEGLEPPTSTV